MIGGKPRLGRLFLAILSTLGFASAVSGPPAVAALETAAQEAALTQRIEQARARLLDTGDQEGAPQLGKLAQWFNWPNYWGNFSNGWRNW